MLRVNARLRRLLGWRKCWVLLSAALVLLLLLTTLGSLRSYEDEEDDANEQSRAVLNGLRHLGNKLASGGKAEGVGAQPQAAGSAERPLSGPGVWHFPFRLNVSATGVSALLQDGMKLEELQKAARRTLAYMIANQPDFDANAGSCRCGRIAETCRCCARLTAKQLQLEQTACVDFTYLVNKRAIKARIVLEKQLVIEKLLRANRLPVLCAGSQLELCASFRNTTYAVQMHSTHKTALKGCLDLLVNLQNRTIYAYPLGCFQSKGDTDRLEAAKGREYHVHMENWVP